DGLVVDPRRAAVARRGPEREAVRLGRGPGRRRRRVGQLDRPPGPEELAAEEAFDADRAYGLGDLLRPRIADRHVARRAGGVADREPGQERRLRAQDDAIAER